MLYVSPQEEPAGFDQEVRQKGLKHLQDKKTDLTKPLPPNSKIKPYWRAFLPEMHSLYGGVCAYLAIHFERVTGAGSVDHFVAKSTRADLAYEWTNYRLACSVMNSRKKDYEDVLDPFEIEDGWFRIELVSGRIYPNPDLSHEKTASIQETINRLKLDDGGNREVRARHFQEYCQGEYTTSFLRKRSPFVWFEANRQGLL